LNAARRSGQVGVRLHDRDGLPLDIGDRMPTLERIQLSVQAGDAEPVVIVIGGAPPAALLERLARADKAAASLEARSWRGGTAPWHDRFYLWQGGGLSVGTSPSGLGKRVARIDRLNANEAAGWQNLFNTWWASADVAAV
jgi:hypothetical protein